MEKKSLHENPKRAPGTEKVIFRVRWHSPFWEDQSLFPLSTLPTCFCTEEKISSSMQGEANLFCSRLPKKSITQPRGARHFIPLCTAGHRKRSGPAGSEPGLCFPPTSCRVHLAPNPSTLFVKLALARTLCFEW